MQAIFGEQISHMALEIAGEKPPSEPIGSMQGLDREEIQEIAIDIHKENFKWNTNYSLAAMQIEIFIENFDMWFPIKLKYRHLTPDTDRIEIQGKDNDNIFLNLNF